MYCARSIILQSFLSHCSMKEWVGLSLLWGFPLGFSSLSVGTLLVYIRNVIHGSTVGLPCCCRCTVIFSLVPRWCTASVFLPSSICCSIRFIYLGILFAVGHTFFSWYRWPLLVVDVHNFCWCVWDGIWFYVYGLSTCTWVDIFWPFLSICWGIPDGIWFIHLPAVFKYPVYQRFPFSDAGIRFLGYCDTTAGH